MRSKIGSLGFFWAMTAVMTFGCGGSTPTEVAAPPDTAGVDSSGGEGGVDSGPGVDTGVTDGVPTDTTVTPDTPGAGSIKTVFIILMENHNWSSIKGNKSAPYMNTTLLPMAAHAENYFNPPGLHPSEPNYIWLEAGSNLGVTADGEPAAHHQSTKDHLVTLLTKAGISWKAYAEDIDGKSCPLVNAGLFVTRHVPMLDFDDVTDTNTPTSKTCIDHVRPYTELATDLAGGTGLARYNFIVPNLCNDGHGETLGTKCNTFIADLVKLGDTWMSTEVPKILASEAYKTGALFITWDEGEGTLKPSDGPIGMIVLSPFGKGGGYSNTIKYTHSSTLRTMQEIFAVSPFLRDAAAATDLSDLFKTFP
jgi:hypothetical protein